MFASKRSAPRVNRGGGFAQPHLLAQAVRAGVVARRDQRLRVDVEAARRPCAEPQRCQRQHAGAAAEIDHRAAARRMSVEPFETERRRRVRARAESEPGIHGHDHRAPGSSTRSCRGHTQSRRPKRIAWKSRIHSRSQSAIGDCARVEVRRIHAERAAQRAQHGLAVRVRREKGRQARRRPEPEFPGRRLENRRELALVGVHERDGDRSAADAGGFGVVRRKLPEIQADLEEDARNTRYLSPKRLSR